MGHPTQQKPPVLDLMDIVPVVRHDVNATMLQLVVYIVTQI
jgi:hypothetical protein